MKIPTFDKHSFMTTITQIRRSNLIRLRNHIEKQFKSNPENELIRFTDMIFCEIVGISSSTYSQLKKSKHKPYFNEIYARSIETKINLELGWFDIDRESNNFKALRLNYDQFNEGLISYNHFMNSKKLSVTDKDVLERIRKELFMFIYKKSDINTSKVTESDFLNFLKD